MEILNLEKVWSEFERKIWVCLWAPQVLLLDLLAFNLFIRFYLFNNIMVHSDS